MESLKENNSANSIVSTFCRWRNINSFQIECGFPKCAGWIPLSQLVPISLLEDVALLEYTLLILESSHIFTLKKWH